MIENQEFTARGKKNRLKIRIMIVLIPPIILLGAALFKSYQYQIEEHDKLNKDADAQHWTKPMLKAKRGDIYDRNGSALAITVEQHSIYARPRLVKDKARTARTIADTLDISLKTVQKKLDSPAKFVWIERQVDNSRAEALLKLKLPGVGSEKEQTRFYPYNELAGQIIGFVNIDSKGLEGLEKIYNKELSGHSRQIQVLRDGKGRRLFSNEDINQMSLEGNSLVLTLDRSIQHKAEEELAKSVILNGAKSGKMLIMDPHTGGIIAMAHYPFFNPNNRDRSPTLTRNRSVSDIYEPGSVLKPFTIAAALEEKVVGLDTKIDCERGRYRIGGHTIGDHDPQGVLSVKEILMVSSNIGSAKIGQKLGKERLHHWLTMFGFGSKTNSGLPGEVGGIIRPPSIWPEITLATVSFGQGIAVTPLQMVTALAAITNGGVLMKPRIVDGIRDSNNQLIHSFSPEVVHRVISEKTAKQTRDAMVAVVHEKGGTGSRSRIPGFRSGGKTGTAQQVDPLHHGYADIWVGSFMGFAPAENPRLVAIVSIDDPNPVRYGGIVAAPVFSKVMEFALKHLEITPDDENSLVATANGPAHSREKAVSKVSTSKGASPTDTPVMAAASGNQGSSAEGTMTDNNGTKTSAAQHSPNQLDSDDAPVAVNGNRAEPSTIITIRDTSSWEHGAPESGNRNGVPAGLWNLRLGQQQEGSTDALASDSATVAVHNRPHDDGRSRPGNGVDEVREGFSLEAATGGDYGSTITIPDLRGMSMREALKTASNLKLVLHMTGTGIGVNQSPVPGTVLPAGSPRNVSVEFSM